MDSETARTALQGLVGCAGAVGQGGSCGTAAAGAAASVVLNNIIQGLSGPGAKELTAEQKEARVNLVASLVGGLAAALGGDSAVATLAAQIETENNYLGQKTEGFRASEQRQFDAAIASCSSENPDSCNRARELSGMSAQRDKELASACANGEYSLCRAAIQLATASGNVVFFDQRGVPFAVPADSPMIQATPDPRDGTWHYTIAAGVAEGLAIDSGGGALSGVGSAIRGLIKPGVAEIAVGAKATGGVVDRATTGIEWGKGIQGQGLPWEDYLGTQLPAGSRLPPNFKTFDFFDRTTGIATSAKTLDTTTAAKIANPSQIYSSLKGNIDSAAGFAEYSLKGVTVSSSQITRRELQVAVPKATTSAQWDQINRAIEYGQGKSVTVRITRVD